MLFVFTWFFLRLWGQNQVVSEYPFKVFSNTAENFVIIPWEKQEFLTKNSNYLLYASIYVGENNKLLIRPWMDQNKDPRLLEKKSNPTRPLLSDFLSETLESYPEAKFFLNVDHNHFDIHTLLHKMITDFKIENQILIQSQYPAILETLRRLLPVSPIGTSSRDWVKLKALESIGLESVANLKGDFWQSGFLFKGKSIIDVNMITELKRRKIKVVIGPLLTKDEVKKAKEFSADGLFVVDPLLLQ